MGTNIKSIGSNAFYGCSGLTSISIPNSVMSIGANAFYGCGLKSVTIPSRIYSIGNNAFGSCFSITQVNISDLSAWCNINFTNNAANPLYYAKHLYLNNKGIIDLEIPNNVEYISDYAFINSSITSLTIPSSITSIGTNAFSGCSSLATVTWNTKNILDIQNIFTDSSIQTMIIGDEVEVVPANFCKSMSSLTKLVLGKNVRTISSNAFNGCIGLTSLEIPNSLTSLESNAFYGSGLKQLTIPNSVTSIGHETFAYCSDLTSVTLPQSLKDLEQGTFSNCSGLMTITIPNSVATIGQSAFNGCSGLTSITIPSSITAIGYSAFNKCSNLTKVNISDLSAWCNLAFAGEAANPLYYAQHLYLNDKEITDLVIPDSVVTIGDYAFSYCESITSAYIPNGVKNIGSSAFSHCRKLRTIDIGTGVENIGSGAFAYCPYIKDITIKAEYPPVCTYNTFQGCGTEDASGKETFTNINLYVMKSSMSMYQKTSVWKDFNIRPIAAQSTYTDKVTVTPYTNSADISWPAIDDADTYNLTISNNGTMVCQHQFNESGQLMSVVYRMPSATNDAQLAEALGFQYTITDLASGTKYDFNLLIQDKTQKTIKTYTGTFITEGATALEYVHFDGNISDLISQPSTMIFNLQGQNVSNQRDNLAQGTYIVHNDGKAYKILINH